MTLALFWRKPLLGLLRIRKEAHYASGAFFLSCYTNVKESYEKEADFLAMGLEENQLVDYGVNHVNLHSGERCFCRSR